MNLVARIMLAMCLAVTMPSLAVAQLSINNIQVVNSSGAPTDDKVITQPGASVTLRNDFGVDLIVRFCNKTTGEILFETTVPANKVITGNHGLGDGAYDIKVGEAVAPPGTPSCQTAGTLAVQTP